MPSAAGKTFGTNGDDCTQLAFWFSSGSANVVNAGNVGVQSGTIVLWGVQLEIGSVATPLEKPDPQQDLAKCQRFYALLYGSTLGTSTTGSAFGQWLSFPTMRVAPTITLVLAGSYNNASGGTFDQISINGFRVSATVTNSASGPGFFQAWGVGASADL